jgi:hypothetical protein
VRRRTEEGCIWVLIGYKVDNLGMEAICRITPNYPGP